MVKTDYKTRRALCQRVSDLNIYSIRFDVVYEYTNFHLAISYIPGGPAVEKAIYGTSDAQINAAQGNIRDNGTPPTRPANDTQVEEFLKEQYKSKQGDLPEIGQDNGMTGA